MKLGFIGIGQMARHHAAAAVSLGAEITAACSSSIYSDDWADWPYPSHKCSTIAEVASHCDKMVVAVPWDRMTEVSRDAMRLRPCLLEKPVALSVDAVPSGDAFVGFNRRFYKSVQRLKSKGTDNLVSVHVVISEWVHHHIALTGRAVIPYLLEYTSCHTLDLLLYLLGEDIQFDYLRSANDRINGLLICNDIPIHLSINNNDPSPIGLWFRYPDELWKLSPLEKLEIYHGIEITDSVPRVYSPRLIETVGNSSHAVPQVLADQKPGILSQMSHFLAGDTSIAANLDDQRRVLALIHGLKHL